MAIAAPRLRSAPQPAPAPVTPSGADPADNRARYAAACKEAAALLRATVAATRPSPGWEQTSASRLLALAHRLDETAGLCL